MRYIWCAVLCIQVAVLHSVKLNYTALDCSVLRDIHYTALYYTTLHYTILHCTTLYYTTLHYTTLHCSILHCTTLHCTTPSYTPLHHTPVQYITNLIAPHGFIKLTSALSQMLSVWSSFGSPTSTHARSGLEAYRLSHARATCTPLCAPMTSHRWYVIRYDVIECDVTTWHRME